MNSFDSPAATRLWRLADAADTVAAGAVYAAAATGSVYALTLLFRGAPKNPLIAVSALLALASLAARIVAAICEKRAERIYHREMSAWLSVKQENARPAGARP